jgi:hypothetical protein
MKRIVLLLFLTLVPLRPSLAQEAPNFSILLAGGGGSCSGFLGSGNPAPEAGLWLGVRLSNRWEGLWGLDYYQLPSQVITLLLPSPSEPVSTTQVMPSDDIALSVNVRWYWSDKYDEVHQRFNTVPYFIAGFGMDLVVDAYPRTPGAEFYSLAYDQLFALNFGAGIDCPLGDGRQWFFYSEGMDHLIAWQGVTQILSLRAGFKVMLDSAHIDPFR